MQTDFSRAQIADPDFAASEAVIRKCVHCGFCTATCPTYVLLGDELDSPRGRIYLMKSMLEGETVPTAQVVKHIDRCLSCLSCLTTCPSDVNYMHLVDHARAYIERTYTRPWQDRLLRACLAATLPYPKRFRWGLRLARLVRPAESLLSRWQATKPLAAMLSLAPRSIPAKLADPSTHVIQPRGHVALLQGCAEPVLKPQFRAAATRLLNRIGYVVVETPGEGCCGALTHHLGREDDGLASARRNIDSWERAIELQGLSAILVTASGCGTMIKNYGHMLRSDAAYAERAARISALARDISEFLAEAGLPVLEDRGVAVAYQAACSLQHGQKVTEAPRRLLEAAGYTVRVPRDAHLCCGSAGSYNILQPDIAAALGQRKATAIEALGADVIATGNVGCAVQIGKHSRLPIVHTIELLDWATGGPTPAGFEPRTERSAE